MPRGTRGPPANTKQKDINMQTIKQIRSSPVKLSTFRYRRSASGRFICNWRRKKRLVAYVSLFFLGVPIFEYELNKMAQGGT